MLDTIKLGIPLTQAQHRCIQKVADDQAQWQWVQFNANLGELRFVRSTGIVKTDGHSYHRELRWDADSTWSTSCKLWLEFSIPKFWYGHNIHLLHDFLPSLQCLKDLLDQLFGLKGKVKLTNPGSWQIYRADICYAWRFPSQFAAQQYLDSLTHLHYPRKEPQKYKTALFFPGKTYSFKLYLKLPEFRLHDLKALRKANASPEWMSHLEAIADGVLRCEVTLRHRWLKKNGFSVVEDLLRPALKLRWDENLLQDEGFDPRMASVMCLGWWGRERDIEPGDVWHTYARESFREGHYCYCPPLCLIPEDLRYSHAGGGFTVVGEKRLYVLLQGFIDKFLGGDAHMLKADQVQAKLMESYKPTKAARLISFWLYVQRFGTDKAKEIFGKDIYYRSRRELKQAGVSLIEAVDDEFLREFTLSIPSLYVVNQHDDFREQGNVLNFVPKVSGM